MALQWPLDLFEERADYAKVYEEKTLEIDAKTRRQIEVAEAAARVRSQRRATAIRLPPFILQ